jgi:hypothetical protein
MPGPKRTPIARAARTVISPEAVAVYQQMRRLRCSCGPYPDPKKWTGRKQCAACERWWDLHSKLADLIPHKPWMWPVICPPTKYPEYDFGLQRFTNELRPRQGNDRMRAMEKALREAARAAKAPAQAIVDQSSEPASP